MMGYSYKKDDTPLQCFNPANNWQLGWYEPNIVEIDPFAGSWTGQVIGVADFSKASPNHYVVVKIDTGGTTNLFLGYNRKKGMNSGVKDAGDMVTIVEQGAGYTPSNFRGELSKGSRTVFSKFGNSKKDLVIDFVTQSTTVEGVDIAQIAVYFSG
jgi:hypothetical protein